MFIRLAEHKASNNFLYCQVFFIKIFFIIFVYNYKKDYYD